MKRKSKLTKDSALAFLREHQPMPDTNLVDCEELIEEWARVCEYFTKHPCLESVPLFLGSFGGGDGYEMYQAFGDMIEEYNPEDVLPYFIDALNSPSLPIREQAAEASLAIKTKNTEFIDALFLKIEDHDEEDSVREWCALALCLRASFEDIDPNEYEKKIQSILERENNQKVAEELNRILDMIK